MRERERGREGESERERVREREGVWGVCGENRFRYGIYCRSLFPVPCVDIIVCLFLSAIRDVDL